MGSVTTPSSRSIVIHLEGRLHPTVQHFNECSIVWSVNQWLRDNFESLSVDQDITALSPLLAKNIERLSVTEVIGSDADSFPMNEVDLDIHLYQLHPEPVAAKALEGGAGDNEEPPTSRISDLPSSSFDGLWDSLIFEPDIKTKLLHFISTLFLFVEQNVSFVCIGFNRLILLHGPPGSGKTSLSRALAQKLSIRLSNRFSLCKLIEINSHNLFSKYFSESGKLVGKLFDEILDMLSDPKLFVVVLIDEVETLISARKAAANGNEPTDGLRVVNALLTSLDQLRAKHNVIVLTTSNLIQAMDSAFLDRADIKQFVDAPKAPAAYSILRNCFNELMRAGIIVEKECVPCSAEAALCLYSSPDAPSSRLWKLSRRCVGMSGRTLGKLPVMMHAGYIQKRECTMEEALNALEKAVDDEIKSARQTNGNGNKNHGM